MFRIAIIFIALLAVAPQHSFAVRVLEVVEQTYELALAKVELPTSTSGVVAFQSCESCSRTLLPVSASTQYSVNRQPVTLTDLLHAVSSLSQAQRSSENAGIDVSVNLKTKAVTRIALVARNFQ